MKKKGEDELRYAGFAPDEIDATAELFVSVAERTLSKLWKIIKRGEMVNKDPLKIAREAMEMSKKIRKLK